MNDDPYMAPEGHDNKRDLIRPTLFMIARLGLFLSAVAWVVGQWWSCELRVARIGVSTQVDTRAWFVMRSTPSSKTSHFEINPAKNIPDDGFEVEMILPGAAPVQGLVTTTKWWQFAGLGYAKTIWGIRVSIRHWFIVTISTTFNIFLHWFYRKRPEVQPCEN